MADKRKKHTGLDRPEVEGMEALFGGSEPTIQTQSDKQRLSQSTPAETKPEDEDEEARKVKTSLYLSQEALDLLHELKYTARKREGRFVAIGELLDRAVRDLAEKMDVSLNG